MRHDRTFFRESFGVFFFLFEKRFRHEEREIGILMPGRLEHVIQRALHLLPDREAVRLDDHTASNRRILGQVGALDEFVVPLGIVFASFR